MKIIKRADLLTKLESVQPGLSERESIEQSSCFVFRNGKVHTFNNEVSCSVNCDVGFEGAVHAIPLVEILRKLPEDEVEFGLSENRSELLVKGRRRAAGITCDAKVTLPLGSVDKPGDWASINPLFLPAVDMVQHCASKEDSKFDYTCVHITPKFIEACDNSQMARYELETGLKTPVLVRRDSIKHIVQLAMVKINETENWIHFRNAQGVVLSCRRYVSDTEYRDLGKLMDFEGQKIELPGKLEEAIDKASVFLTRELEDPQVIVELAPQWLTVRATGGSGWYREKRKCTYSGPAFSFMIKPALLVEIAKKYKKAEITPGRLKFQLGKATYVSALAKAKTA